MYYATEKSVCRKMLVEMSNSVGLILNMSFDILALWWRNWTWLMHSVIERECFRCENKRTRDGACPCEWVAGGDEEEGAIVHLRGRCSGHFTCSSSSQSLAQIGNESNTGQWDRTEDDTCSGVQWNRKNPDVRGTERDALCEMLHPTLAFVMQKPLQMDF